MTNIQPQRKTRAPLSVFLTLLITLPLAYYAIVLLHEWSHGTTAWLFGYKESPFDIKYGGWFMLHCDEAVPYDSIIGSGHGVRAALIGISGFTINTFLFFLSLFFLNKKYAKLSLFMISLLYWSCVINIMAMFGYIPLDTFSEQGDIGRFVHGLNISPWLVFVPGCIMVVFGLYKLLYNGIIKVYVSAPVKTILWQRVLLGISLIIIFLLLYTHGYNPLNDKGTTTFSKVLAGISVLLVPLLFFVCNPSRKWVKDKINSI